MTINHLIPGLLVLIGAAWSTVQSQPGIAVVGWFMLGIGTVCGASVPFSWEDQSDAP